MQTEPKFKVGDIVKFIGGKTLYEVEKIGKSHYQLARLPHKTSGTFGEESELSHADV